MWCRSTKGRRAARRRRRRYDEALGPSTAWYSGYDYIQCYTGVLPVEIHQLTVMREDGIARPVVFDPGPRITIDKSVYPAWKAALQEAPAPAERLQEMFDRLWAAKGVGKS